MIDHLKIVGKTIDSTDSDVSSSYTIPNSNASSFRTSYTSNPNNQAAYIDPTYGGYYTFMTATAGTGGSYTSDGQSAPSSICPIGWRLPKGGNSGEFVALKNLYNSGLIDQPIPGFTGSGYVSYSSGTLVNATGYKGYGDYWSSMTYDREFAYKLNVSGTSISPATPDERVYGFAVRCVAR